MRLNVLFVFRWSYGVVLWEMFTLAQQPYGDCDFDESLLIWIIEGKRLDRPRYASEEL